MTTSSVLPLHVGNVSNLLGEGVIWDHRSKQLLWTDIESLSLWRWEVPDGELSHCELPERLGSFALTEDPSVILGAFESGFARYSFSSQSFEMLAPITQLTSGLRMNDGRVDRVGSFWAGSMPETDEAGPGALWRYDGDGGSTRHIDDLRIPNSLCWSLDGKRMYFADSPRCTIWTYDFVPDAGPVGEPRIFATTPSGIHPDGSCIDSEDHLWNAQWGAGQIVRYRPDGTVERRLDLPVSQPTCVTFAGKNLDLLCITSARLNLTPSELEQQPLAGALLVYQCDVTGCPEEICSCSH